MLAEGLADAVEGELQRPGARGGEEVELSAAGGQGGEEHLKRAGPGAAGKGVSQEAPPGLEKVRFGIRGGPESSGVPGFPVVRAAEAKGDKARAGFQLPQGAAGPGDEDPEPGFQEGAVVGVFRKGVGEAQLPLLAGGADRPGIDPAGSLREGDPEFPEENGQEGGGKYRHFSDPQEVELAEAFPDGLPVRFLAELGDEVEGQGREEALLLARPDGEDDFRLDEAGGGVAQELVRGEPDGAGQEEALLQLPPDPERGVGGRAEEAAGPR